MCDFMLISAYYLSLIRSRGVQNSLMVALHVRNSDHLAVVYLMDVRWRERRAQLRIPEAFWRERQDLLGAGI